MNWIVVGSLSMVLASAAIAHGIGQSSTTPPRAAIERAQTTDEFLARWKDERNSKLALGAMWTASHSDVGPDRWEAAFQPAYLFMEAIEKGDRASLDPKGIKAFKDRLSGMLKDDDQAIRAFAALLLGVCGDKSYANQVAVLLRPRRATGDFPVYDRGRAAMALGLLGAKEHTLELVGLLKSPNSFDRSGAAFGLGALRATEHIAAVAALLEDADENVRTNAQEGLAMMREPAK